MKAKKCAAGKEGHHCRVAKKCFWARRHLRKIRKHLRHSRKFVRRARRLARKCNRRRHHSKKPKCTRGKAGKACRKAKKKSIKT